MEMDSLCLSLLGSGLGASRKWGILSILLMGMVLPMVLYGSIPV